MKLKMKYLVTVCVSWSHQHVLKCTGNGSVKRVEAHSSCKTLKIREWRNRSSHFHCKLFSTLKSNMMVEDFQIQSGHFVSSFKSIMALKKKKKKSYTPS